MDEQAIAKRMKELVRFAETWELFLCGWYYVTDAQGRAWWVSPRNLVIPSERSRT